MKLFPTLKEVLLVSEEFRFEGHVFGISRMLIFHLGGLSLEHAHSANHLILTLHHV